MDIEKAKSILRRKAIKKNPNKLLSYCSEAVCWDDCFMEADIKDKNHLVFYYNLPSGATLNEAIYLSE
jgi:hypothetical protein